MRVSPLPACVGWMWSAVFMKPPPDVPVVRSLHRHGYVGLAVMLVAVAGGSLGDGALAEVGHRAVLDPGVPRVGEGSEHVQPLGIAPGALGPA